VSEKTYIKIIAAKNIFCSL